ncbi:hypothetical protein [Natrinema sp. H-ect4]|uniref:hypothetical protein n=1 Tax=Natrinema sp. H-ect4 TaxID=3242699 RepID=UPI0035A8D121
MNLRYTARLEDFGVRSLLTHAIMAMTFAGAVVTGLFIDGQLGLVSFVAFLNFTAGVWIAQSIHSLGNARTDDSYNGIIAVLLDSTGEKTFRGLDTGRLARLLTLIAGVTAVSLLVSGEVLSGAVASIGAVAIGAVALVTAMVGFLIAMGSAFDESERRATRTAERERNRGGVGQATHQPTESDDGSTVRISVREAHVDEPASDRR